MYIEKILGMKLKGKECRKANKGFGEDKTDTATCKYFKTNEQKDNEEYDGRNKRKN